MGDEPATEQGMTKRSHGVAAGEQQRPQTIDRPRLGCGEFPVSAEQNA
jgi:hypothetical protein